MKLGKKFIGAFRQGDRTYVSYRTPEHYFRKYKGFGISTSILKKLRKKGCRRIIIIYQETPEIQRQYKTVPDMFYQKGIIYKDKVADHQRILPLKHFKDERRRLSDYDDRTMEEITVS